MYPPAAPGIGYMDGVGNEPGAHAPVEVANRSPRGLEVSDAVEQGAPDQKLRNRHIHRSTEEVKQSVKWRSSNVLPRQEFAAAVSEHRSVAPPVADRLHTAAMFVNWLQRTVCDVALRVCIESRHELLQAIGRHCVVARGDVDIVAACRPDARTPAAGCARARALPGSRPGLAGRHVTYVLPRAVCRITIVNQEFPVAERLRVYGLEPFRKER